MEVVLIQVEVLPLLKLVDPVVAAAVQHLILVQTEILHQLHHRKEIMVDQDIIAIRM